MNLKLTLCLPLVALNVLLFVAPAYAAPVSVEQAATEASSFLNHGAPSRLKGHRAVSANMLVPVYTAESASGACFYVFNNRQGEGFTIVSADDRLPGVLGFSNNGNFNIDSIPANMKWWLEGYRKEIGTFLERNVETGAVSEAVAKARKARRYASDTDRAEIKPLLKTLWDQTDPYNLQCPISSVTRTHSPTGCVATAMAQVMKFHEWPVHPKGVSAGVNFNNTTLDWANMIDTYVNHNWTAEQADAVALLMRQCGASVNMMYGHYESGAYSHDVPVALYTYFGYSESIQTNMRDYYSQLQWNNLIYDELSKNRPVYYGGSSPAGGHAFVCDGYLSNEYFHFNWGWGGYQDGYFRLNSLDPSVGGTGSFGGGFNSGQIAFTGVKPSSGETDRQRMIVASGAFEYSSANQSFVVTGGESFNLFYNPLGYSQTFNIGVRVEPFEGGTQRYFMSSSSTSVNPYYGFPEYKVTITGLSNGKYKVYPAMYTDQKVWEDVKVPYGVQNYVTLEVSGGKYTYTNAGIPTEMISDIIMAIPDYVSPIYEGDALAFNTPISNVGGGDYFKYSILGLYSDDPFAPSATMSYMTSVPGNTTADVKFTSEVGLDAGKYDIYFFDADYKELREPVSITIRKRPTPLPKPSGNLSVLSVNPNFMTSGTETGISVRISNAATTEVQTDLVVVLYKAKDMSEVYRISTTEPYSVESGKEVQATFAPRELNLNPGDYYWICYDGKGNTLSVPQPLKVYGQDIQTETGIYRVIDEDAKNARLVGVYSDKGETDFVIPGLVGEYSVRSMGVDVFAFNGMAKSVSLPATIVRVPAAAFYRANALESLTMRGTAPAVVEPRAFNDERVGEIVLSGGIGGYSNIYHITSPWSLFKMSNWEITWDADVKITGGLLKDASGTFFNPYYVGATERVDIEVDHGEKYSIRADVEIDGEKSVSRGFGSVRLPALEGSAGKVHLSLAPATEGVELTGEEMRPFTVYTVDGRVVLRNALPSDLKKLPKGIYIAKGKKIAL